MQLKSNRAGQTRGKRFTRLLASAKKAGRVGCGSGRRIEFDGSDGEKRD